MSEVQGITNSKLAKVDIRMDVNEPINLLDRDAVKLIKATLIEKSIVDCLRAFEKKTGLNPVSITISSPEYSVLADWHQVVAGKGWISTNSKNVCVFESYGKITVIPGCNCKPGVAYVQWLETPEFYDGDEDKDD